METHPDEVIYVIFISFQQIYNYSCGLFSSSNDSSACIVHIYLVIT